MRISTLTWAFGGLLATGVLQQPSALAGEGGEDVVSSGRLRVRLDVGFAHWFADSFRSADQLKSPSFGLGFRPGLSWLEIRARYDSVIPRASEGTALTGKRADRRASFSHIEIVLSRTLDVDSESITVSYGGGPLWVQIPGHQRSLGQSFGIGVEYLFGPPILGARLGAFLDAREQGYSLKAFDGDEVDQIDFNVALGVVVTLLDHRPRPEEP